MTKTAEAFGKEAFDTNLKSFAAFSKGAQAIAAEAGELFKKGVEGSAAAMQDVMQARSLEDAFDIQSKFAKSAYEDFVSGATKMTNLYTELATEMFKPFESAIAKAK